MQRKVFLPRNLPKGKHSYLKLFLWSAVALIVLVLVTPLLTRHKGSKEAPRKPIPEKTGMVVKEIPRSPLPEAASSIAPVEGSAGAIPTEPPPAGTSPSEEKKPPGAQAPVSASAPPLENNTPADVKPLEKSIQVDVSPRKAQDSPDAQQKDHAAELAMAQPSFGQQVFKDSEPAVKPNPVPPVVSKEKPVASAANKTERPPLMGPGAKQRGAAGAVASVQKPSKPASGDGALFSSQASIGGDSQKTEARKTDSEKKSTDSSGLLFTVQVGSFKEKQNAEEMQQSLQKKGYAVLLKPVVHPTLGQLYVVQLQPVADVSKASTLMMQIKHEEKVKPVILKTPGGQ